MAAGLSVSVLIPAFRPTFLGQAIASVLAQGHEDFELIVSDDSGGGELLPIVERFRDPRILYVRTAGRTGGVQNMRSLWPLAKHDLVQYLFDDDLLMPHALGTLVDEIAAAPDSSFAFGPRQIVDHRGRILQAPQPFSVARGRLTHAQIAQSMLTRIVNPVGEFSNVMINRAAGITDADLVAYEGFEMRVVSDVGFYLNATLRAPCAAVNTVVGAFRRHQNQASSPAFNPWFAVGLCEWELYIRGEHRRGVLSAADTLTAVEKLASGYVHWSKTVPLIGRMIPSLQELRQRVEVGDTEVLDDVFGARWQAFVAEVAEEKARRETRGSIEAAS